MEKKIRILLIICLIFGVLSAASCGKPLKSAQLESAPAGTSETAETAEPTAAEPTTEPAAQPTTEPAAQGLSAEAANRYLGISDRLNRQYGVGKLSDNGCFLRGLAFVKLLDLDGDGVEELVCAYENPDRSEFFPYVNEYAVYGPDSDEPLFDPRPVCNFGNGDAPGLEFLTRDGRVYVEIYESGLRIGYFHLENGRLQSDILFKEAEDPENGTVMAWLNGEECGSDDGLAALEQFEAGALKERFLFYDYDRTGTLTKMLSDTNLTLARLETPGGTGS